jgi:iron complex transport system substrate-binding protein
MPDSLAMLTRDMRKRLIASACWVLLLNPFITAAHAADPQVVIDDRGQAISFSRPMQRVVSLAPFITELLYAAGAGERLVGVSAYSDFPPAARALPQISAGAGIDVEKVLALRPDLVVAWGSGTGRSRIAQLESLGLRVFVSEPRRLQDIPDTLRRFGALMASGETAGKQASAFERRWRELQRRYAGQSTLRVFFQIERQPLMTLNSRHIVNDVLRLCGGQNVFADLASLAPAVSLESVIDRDPQVIFISGAAQRADTVMAEWRTHQLISAVRHRQVFMVPSEWIVRHTPRILEGAGMICEKLRAAREVYR